MLANHVDSSNQHKRSHLSQYKPAKGCKPVTEKLLSTFTCSTRWARTVISTCQPAGLYQCLETTQGSCHHPHTGNRGCMRPCLTILSQQTCKQCRCIVIVHNIPTALTSSMGPKARLEPTASEANTPKAMSRAEAITPRILASELGCSKGMRG